METSAAGFQLSNQFPYVAWGVEWERVRFEVDNPSSGERLQPGQKKPTANLNGEIFRCTNWIEDVATSALAHRLISRSVNRSTSDRLFRQVTKRGSSKVQRHTVTQLRERREREASGARKFERRWLQKLHFRLCQSFDATSFRRELTYI